MEKVSRLHVQIRAPSRCHFIERALRQAATTATL
jgi:hypothetical protein